MENIIKLSFDDVYKLRKEITLNSIYLKDYNNTLNIENKETYDFFDGYVEYLDELKVDDETEYLIQYYELISGNTVLQLVDIGDDDEILTIDTDEENDYIDDLSYDEALDVLLDYEIAPESYIHQRIAKYGKNIETLQHILRRFTPYETFYDYMDQ